MEALLTFYSQYNSTFNFVLVLVGTLVAAQIILFVFQAVLSRVTAKTATKLDDELVAVVKRPVYFAILIGGVYFALLQIEFVSIHKDVLLLAAKLFLVLLFIVLGVGVTNTMLLWVEKNGKLTKKKAGFVDIVRKLVNALIYFMGVIFILQLFGLAISPLIASLGIGGLAIGLALQPTLSNYFSGLYIAADGFVKPDDFIELDDNTKGYVVSVGWRNTVIRLWNNNLVMIPNARLADSMITNYNEPENKMSFLLHCGIAYGTDLKKAERVALQVGRELQKDKKFGVAGYKPLVRFYEFGDSNINFKLILQARSRADHFEMLHEAIKELKAAFDKAGISISFPVRTVEFSNPKVFTS